MRHPSRRSWTLLAALLAACQQTPIDPGLPVSEAPPARELEHGASAPLSATGEWFEVISQLPGPEVTDAAWRRRVEESGHAWKVRERVTGIEMVLVLPGEFLMGSPESEAGRGADEGPRHRVRLTQSFYLGATELTQGQWRRMMGAHQGFFPGRDKPVDGSWHDLQAFLSKANAADSPGVPPLRAPTEAEWEYACRAGTNGPFSFEGSARHAVLNFNDGVVLSPYIDDKLTVVDGRLEVVWETPPSAGCRMTTAVAGSLPPNAWGLHEMHGNVWEWTADQYDPQAYVGRGDVAVDPFERAVGDEARTLRGGGWYTGALHSRAAVRDEGGTDTRSNRIGFRVARTL